MNDPKTILNAYLDDELTEVQRSELADWMHGSPEHVRSFIAECYLDSLLKDILSEKQMACDVLASCDGLQQKLAVDISTEAVPPTDFAPSTAPGILGFLSLAPRVGAAVHGTIDYLSSHELFTGYLVATLLFAVGILVGLNTYISHVEKTQIAQTQPGKPDTTTTPFDKPLPGLEKPIPLKPVFVGKITGRINCRWQAAKLAPTTNQIAKGDRFALKSGLLEIVYATGARVILQGPCTYTVDSTAGGFLQVGKLTAKLEKTRRLGNEETRRHADTTSSSPSLPVSQSPSLFAVRTPTALVTDLGTEFGVEVDAAGITQSHVFRGKVIFMAMNDGKAVDKEYTLVQNQSARTAFDGDSRKRIIVRTESVPRATAAAFVRNLPGRADNALNLADIVSGGDGTGWRKDGGINPANGNSVGRERMGLGGSSDGVYHRVSKLPMIDGVFIPSKKQKMTTLDSTGHAYPFPGVGGYFYGAISPTTLWTSSESMLDTKLGGVDYDYLGHTILVLHANAGITFDLAAIRAAHLQWRIVRFQGVAGNLASARSNMPYDNAAKKALKTYKRMSADVWVFVDGELRMSKLDFNSSDGAIPIDVPLDDGNRFLTLVSTDAGNGHQFDWVVFGDPQLVLEESKNEE